MLRALLTAIFAVFVFSLAWVLPTAWWDDWSIAQRVVTHLVMPVGLLWLVTLAAAIYHGVRGNRLAGLALLAMHGAIWVSFCPLVADALMAHVEMPLWDQSPVANEAPSYRAIVVLGGAAGRNQHGYTQVHDGGERLVMAAKLWHAGKTPWVICTGTVLESDAPIADQITADTIRRSNQFQRDDPAEVGRELLVELGVPDDRIIRCGGQNTSAEMQHLLALFSQWSPRVDRDLSVSADRDLSVRADRDLSVRADRDLPVGLVTNAFHLPRAQRLADRLSWQEIGIQWIAIPAGSELRSRRHMVLGSLVPTAEAGYLIARGCKELLAGVIGR